MKLHFLSAILLATASLLPAQLADDQKISDLRQLSGLYAKQYGPYEWKRDVAGFDLLNLRPWIDRAVRTKTDLEFADLLVEYVASLNDAHDVFTIPSAFNASLGFVADLYDGKPLLDGINRTLLPISRYPFVIGDELVSVDGVTVTDWIARLSKYGVAANPVSTSRNAVVRITSRPQSRIPWAHMIGENAEVVIRRASGADESYTIPWTKTGMAVTFTGPVPSPGERSVAPRRAVEQFLAIEDSLTEFQRPLAHLYNASVPADTMAVLAAGVRPLFTLPPDFQLRLGGNAVTDAFTSGVYVANGQRIGFIRIPSYSPSIGTTAALQQFDREIQWMNDNTDGLVIDEIRNPGGSVLFVEQLCQRLHTASFRSIGFELRATASDVASFGAVLVAVRAANVLNPDTTPDWLVSGYENRYNTVLAAYGENRGRTGPISLTNYTLDLDPVPWAYAKPIIVLVDEFSASGGDAFPATLQDNGRALIVGKRTMGAGGNVVEWDATNYTEGFTRVTRSLMNRKNPIATADYPTAPYVENIGVRPDVDLEYMTRENLLNAGRPYVAAFTQIIVDHINKSRGN